MSSEKFLVLKISSKSKSVDCKVCKKQKLKVKVTRNKFEIFSFEARVAFERTITSYL